MYPDLNSLLLMHWAELFLEESEESLSPNLAVNEVQLTAYLPISQERYSDFQQASADDPALQALSTIVRNGWPSH